MTMWPIGTASTGQFLQSLNYLKTPSKHKVLRAIVGINNPGRLKRKIAIFRIRCSYVDGRGFRLP